MAITIAELNAQGGLSDEVRLPHLIEGLKRLDADVIVCPEAGPENDEHRLVPAINELEELGYSVFTEPYRDADTERTDRHVLLMASRRKVVNYSPIKLDSRYGMIFDISDNATPIRVLGKHGNDRSEFIRRGQVLDAILARPDIIATDLNGTRWRFAPARALTALPAHYPTAERSITKLERIMNIAHRLGGMAASETMSMLQAAGYKDAAGLHRKATWPSKFPLFALDHILIDARSKPKIHVRDFKVHDGISGADHRPIVAVVET